MGLFGLGKKTKVKDFFPAQELAVLQAIMMPKMITNLMDYNAKSAYQAFVGIAGQSDKTLDRKGVADFLAKAENLAKADSMCATPMANCIKTMKAWLDNPSNK